MSCLRCVVRYCSIPFYLERRCYGFAFKVDSTDKRGKNTWCFFCEQCQEFGSAERKERHRVYVGLGDDGKWGALSKFSDVSGHSHQLTHILTTTTSEDIGEGDSSNHGEYVTTMLGELSAVMEDNDSGGGFEFLLVAYLKYLKTLARCTASSPNFEAKRN